MRRIFLVMPLEPHQIMTNIKARREMRRTIKVVSKQFVRALVSAVTSRNLTVTGTYGSN